MFPRVARCPTFCFFCDQFLQDYYDGTQRMMYGIRMKFGKGNRDGLASYGWTCMDL